MREQEGGPEVPAVAVLLRHGQALDAAELRRKVAEKLDGTSRPVFVRMMDELPTTAGYRVLKAALRAEGIPAGDVARGRCLRWDAAAREYVTMQPEASSEPHLPDC